MAEPKLFITFLFFLSLVKMEKSGGVTLKMVHRDSIESPLYPGNLTFNEKFERLIAISRNQATNLSSNTRMQPNFKLMHPEIRCGGFQYMVKIGIGNPAKEMWLLIDTGSSLTWLQCEPCQSCYKQSYPIFEPRLSSTYKTLPCSISQLYFPHCGCPNNCTYIVEYTDGTMTKGIVSTETFRFEPLTKVSEVVFGCSTFTKDLYFVPSVAGIMGLNMNKKSMILQLGSFVSTRFSYCLVDPFKFSKVVTYLKFGNDMGYIGDETKRTPFEDGTNSDNYYLKLLDISINGKRLNFPAGTFKLSPEGEGGVLIDSGSPASWFDSSIYDRLEKEFIQYFLGFGLVRQPNCPIKRISLCYALPNNFSSFPTMIYHFEGANMLVQPENVFLINRNDKYFSLVMIKSDGKLNTIGSWNQHDTRMLYDIPRRTLFFVPENCAQDQG